MTVRTKTKWFTSFMLASVLSFNPIAMCLAETSDSVEQNPNLADADGQKLAARVESVDPDSALNKVEDLNRQILEKEIELGRFNLHYKQNVGKVGRWTGWRYAAFQEANFALNMSGAINNLGEQYAHIHDPERNSNNRLGMGNVIGMIGSIIGTSGAILEFSINEYNAVKAARKGFSTRAARKHVLDLKEQINSLLSERDDLVKIEQSAPLLTARTEVDVVEGKILKDIRDLDLLEFSRFHIGQRRYIAFQQALYAFDMAKFSTSAVASAFAFLALHKHDGKWNEKTGILWNISGGLIVAAPVASRVFGATVGKLHSHLISPISRNVETRELATLEADDAALDKLIKEGSAPAGSTRGAIQRAVVYNAEAKGFHDELHQALQARRKANLVATQNIASGFFVGGTTIARGVLYDVAGSRFSSNSPRSTLESNSYTFAGDILGTVGSATALVDTLRLQVKGEVERHKLEKRGQLPSQLLDARLKQLDEMEALLKHETKPSPKN
jgi:hypothetical protein